MLEKTKKISTVKKYCIDCGSRLIYVSGLSTTDVPNEYRKYVYVCMHCSKVNKKTTFFAVRRFKVKDLVAEFEKMLKGHRHKRKLVNRFARLCLRDQ